MQPSVHSSPARRHVWPALLLMLVAGSSAPAAELSVRVNGPSRELAFAQYIASTEGRDLLTKSGPVGIFIEASLPELYKSATLVAVRTQRENEPGEVQVLLIAGDGAVADEVIDPVFALQRRLQSLPLSSVAITPDNYKFHFAGQVKTGASSAYIYDIVPKKNRPGLVAGHLWMDADSGQEVTLSGSFKDMPSTGGRVEIVRDTKLVNGTPFARVTHVSFAVPLLGRAQVSITEIVLTQDMLTQSH
jgi:hypothetical protein